MIDQVQANGEAGAARVFISYSRKDMAVADALVIALETEGFEVLIDRRDLPFGEEWQKVLGEFILAADAVIWLVSPRSIGSQWCRWELEEVQRLGKRLVSVRIAEIDNDLLPEALRKIHTLPIEGLYDPNRHLGDLVLALRRNWAWVREHTRLTALAERWQQHNRSADLLLRGRDIEVATTWAVQRPISFPPLTDLLVEFLMACRFGSLGFVNFTGVVGILSIIVGSLSIVALVKHGFRMGSFVAPIQLVLDYYERAVHALLGWWAEPILLWVIERIQALTSWHLTLEPGWKHIFVLMMLFFSSLMRQFAAASRRAALFMWGLGVTVSTAFSVWLSVLPLPDRDSSPFYILLNSLLLIIPPAFVGLFLGAAVVWYCVIQAGILGAHWLRVFISRPGVPLVGALSIALGCVFALWIGGIVGNFHSDIFVLVPLLSRPRPLVVGLGFVIVAVVFVMWAALNAIAHTKRNGTTWWYEFRTHSWTGIALSMTIVMFGAGTVLAINAGLRLFWSDTAIESHI